MIRGAWTLGRKMIVLLLLASTLPIAITTWLVHRQGRERVREGAAGYLGSVADAAAMTLDGFNARYQRVVAGAVALPEITAACGGDAAQLATASQSVRTLVASDATIFAISVVDPGGRVAVTHDPAFLGISVADRSYHRKAIASPALQTRLLIARGPRALPIVVYAVRFGPAPAPCVMIVATHAGELFATAHNLHAAMGRDSYLQLLDEHGVRIAHSFRDDLLYRPTGRVPADEAEQMILEARFGPQTAALLDQVVASPVQWEAAHAAAPDPRIHRLHTPSNQRDNLAVARRLHTAPWTLFAFVPVEVAEAPAGAMVRWAALVAAIASLAAFAIGLVVARGLLRPVAELGRAAEAIRGGDLTARARVAGRDELAELGTRFNEMAAGLAASAIELEQRVIARTRELTEANGELVRHRQDLMAHRAELTAQKEELRVQRDELERKNVEVERADRMKSEFLANMSHELRTPLNSVIGFADLLQVTTEGRLTANEQSQLGDIVAAGRHLLLIINDILDLAKIEAGQVRLVIEAVDPEELIVGSVAMVQALARPRGLELRTVVEARRAVRGDPDRLRQVLLNLLSNAVKFSPDGAVIDVRVDDAGDHVDFAVTDRGPGMDARLVERLFQPFVQGEQALVKRHQGTGLGLAISKKIVELHGGDLTVETRPGEGATFRVRVLAAGRRTAAGSVPTTATVLLAGDTASLGAHRERLEPAGYRIVFADAGEDLAASAERAGAALVVIDVGSLGADAADAVLASAPRLSQQVPVILLSADPEVLATKPIDPAALQAICRRLVGRGGRPVRALVVDDDLRVPALVASALGPAYTIEATTTVADGLARARAGGHDLLVVDLLLPDGSGLDLLAALADDPATRRIPRVVLTAAALDPAQRERLREHAHAVAHKGMVTPEELLEVVDRLALAPAEPSAPDDQPTILVVDDNDMNRGLVRSILERMSYRVIEARGGDEAIELAERDRPALILMDLAMPGKDGFETTRELRGHAALARTPIVALTALAMRGDEDRARAAGVDAFLTKPLDRAALERTVAGFVAAS